MKAPEGYRIDKKYPVIFTIRDGVLRPELNVITDNVEYEMLDDGKYQFTITNSDISGVKTGDNSNLMLYLIITVIGAAILAGTMVYRRRKDS